MHVVNGQDLARERNARDVMLCLYEDAGRQPVYAMNFKYGDGRVYDYYFDGEEELQFLYKSNKVADVATFQACAAECIKQNTKCLANRDAHLDRLIYTRTRINKVLDGDSTDKTGYGCDSIIVGFDQSDDRPAFSGIGTIGFYQIVPDATWFKIAVECGVKTVQLRMVDKPLSVIEENVQLCSEIAAGSDTRLIVNDHWDLALKYNAYGVHLGQGDIKCLKIEELDRIQRSGMRLGISTHCYHELARARYYRASYVGFGPIFATTAKKMDFAPQGLEMLKTWLGIASMPVVAIGGITLDNIDSVMSTGVDGAALISAVTCARDPIDAIRRFQAVCSRHGKV